MKKKYQGLCSTCLHASICTFPKDPNKPVLECEEFEVIQAPQQNVAKSVTSPSEHAQERQYHGLCVNCKNRKTCIYAKTEGGVWHCEEYR